MPNSLPGFIRVGSRVVNLAHVVTVWMNDKGATVTIALIHENEDGDDIEMFDGSDAAALRTFFESHVPDLLAPAASAAVDDLDKCDMCGLSKCGPIDDARSKAALITALQQIIAGTAEERPTRTQYPNDAAFYYALAGYDAAVIARAALGNADKGETA